MKYMMTPEQLKRHKTALWLMLTTMLTFGTYTIIMLLMEGFNMLVFTTPIFIILSIQFYKEIKRTKSLAYDQEALYYHNTPKDQPVKVLLENVRSIAMANFATSFRINLFSPNEDGKYIYFKLSNWSPFAKKKRLTEIYELRDHIDACKRRSDEGYDGKTEIVRLVEV